MNTSARTVLSLTSSEAIDFFMKSEQYHGFELPVITFRERRAYDEIGY